MEEITAYTGLSPAAFFTVVVLVVALYKTVCSMFVAMARNINNSSNTNAQLLHLGEVTEHQLSLLGSSDTTASPNHPFRYDVFLSFRGEDTRHSFTAHLNQALLRKGINTFIDDEQLRSGEEISPTLLKAIEGSRISIVVFSKTYASSRWCLDELMKIVECKETKGQIVVPVFYKVEPSDVRHQKNSFEKALAKHEKRSSIFTIFQKNHTPDQAVIKLQKWKAALTQVANLSGCPLGNNSDEAEFIDNFVLKISRIVNDTYFELPKYPIGIESRVQKINSLLSIDQMNDRRMVGILGVGGIGKTTIAEAIYNSIAYQFEGTCFLPAVGETSLVKLQNKLLSKIIGRTVKVGCVNEGVTAIKKNLRSRRVLLILDDVDKLLQLEKLVGNVDWFGLGSRIIITTRDKKVLSNHGVVDDLIYTVKELGRNKALELFCRNAFREDKPTDDFMKLMEGAISYVGGLPLALEVLGSHLYGIKDIDQWKSALNKYKNIPHRDILGRLRISYDGLHENERKIFLDIACFFIGKPEDDIKRLDSYDYSSLDGIGVLRERSLITIDGDKILAMHNLLRDMGREVVRLESPEDPGKRSRLWFFEEARQVLEDCTGTIEVQGILLDLPKGDMMRLSSEAFNKMKRLRLLMVKGNVQFSQGPIFLSNELRVFDCPNYPLESLPPNFCGEKLVVLRMHKSHLKRLEGVQNFRSMTIMDLSDCEFLKIIPDVSSIPNLEILTLQGCTDLVEIHHSVGFLEKLVSLDLQMCYKLSIFPRRLKLKSLKYFELTYCSSLSYFPEIECPMECLKSISLAHTAIKKLPSSIQYLLVLENLDLSDCSRLSYFPEIECPMECLKSIGLFGSGIKELPSSIGYLVELKGLYLEGCKNLTNLPSSIYNLQHLVELNLEGCSKLVKFPEKMGDNKQSMPSAVSEKESEISSCLELLPLPPPTNSSVSNDGSSSVVFPALQRLNLKNCVLLESNIFKIFNCSSTLEDLDLSGSAIVTIPACIKRFVCLRRLYLDNCKKLREILELPPNIENVYARRCISLETFLEEPQISQLFNTWCLPELVWVETVFSTPSPLGSGIEPEESSVNNITPDPKAHVGVDASTANYQNVQALQTPQPLREPLHCYRFNASIWGNKIPHWFSYHKEVSSSNSNECEIDIDVPADVDGEITGFAFAIVVVAGTEDTLHYQNSINLCVSVIRGDVIIYRGMSGSTQLDTNHVWMHFLVKGSLKHKVDNDHLRVKFCWWQASMSRFFKSCGFHLIRRNEEKKIDLIDDIQVTKRPLVDVGNLESDWYQQQKRHSSTLGSIFSNAEDMQPGES